MLYTTWKILPFIQFLLRLAAHNLKMVVLHVVSFPASDALLSNKELTRNELQALSDVDGCLGVWYGLQVEDGTTAHMAALWESFEHYQTHAATPMHAEKIAALKPATAGPLNVYHFEPGNDPTNALNSPVTELSVAWLKEGKEDRFEDELKPVAELMTKDIDLVPGSHGPIAWGDVLQEKGKKWGIAIGWDSVEAHAALPTTPPFDDHFTRMVAVAEMKVAHVRFKKL
ncbi:hypothetical protein BJ165DRAFT_1471163 [Panaeolus papilionaceus]|nr:hypothetical protein BJ165DRAFT_1471163 [Panaeolus papilionaceus]